MNLKSASVLRTESFDIANPEVFVETVSDDVSIVESSDGKCHIEISAKFESAKPLVDLVDISANGNKLSIRAGKRNTGLRGLFNFGTSELLIVIKLPKANLLKMKTVSADVSVDQIFNTIDIASVSGDLLVRHNPTGTCSLKTVSGDIKTQVFSACEYVLKSVSGDINVGVAPGLEVDVDGKSVSGDLQSEIALSSNGNSGMEASEIVTISATTVSGDFTLARN